MIVALFCIQQGGVLKKFLRSVFLLILSKVTGVKKVYFATFHRCLLWILVEFEFILSLGTAILTSIDTMYLA